MLASNAKLSATSLSVANLIPLPINWYFPFIFAMSDTSSLSASVSTSALVPSSLLSLLSISDISFPISSLTLAPSSLVSVSSLLSDASSDSSSGCSPNCVS